MCHFHVVSHQNELPYGPRYGASANHFLQITHSCYFHKVSLWLHMPLHITFQAERLLTYITFMWFLFRINCHMVPQIWCACKSLFADNTLKWFLSSVKLNMLPADDIWSIFCITYVACMLHFTIMHLQMFLQSVSLCKRFYTDVTLMWFLTCVHWDMFLRVTVPK